MSAIDQNNRSQTPVVKLLATGEPVAEACVKGWVKTVRRGKEVSFFALNDGSCFASLQVVAESQGPMRAALDNLSTGASVAVRGALVASPASGQDWELHAVELDVVGEADEDFPLQKKRHSFEFLRSIAHLRPRANAFGAVFRTRSRLAYAVHRFFQERGFLYVQTPIITASDCEGAGELFHVSTLAVDQPPKVDGKVDYSQDFFGKQTGLTVSGQLEAELFATAFSDVYTFGPTFRAENSNTSRHAAEFWMIEPEMAFCDLAGDCDLAEEFMRAMVQAALTECAEDLDFFDQRIEKGLIDKLQSLAKAEFKRLSYTEAIGLLEKSGRSFEFPVKWGTDLQSEHERYLTEEVFGGPVFVTDYPKEIKAFYMRMNDDNKTVAAMDLLVPRVGEIIGGSQREDRLVRLDARMAEVGIEADSLWWYRDIRRWGSCPHAGFGLGFERLLMYVTGMENIRDVIPFPRTPGHAEF
jgi:asparaginyl-tRNA synthetase